MPTISAQPDDFYALLGVKPTENDPTTDELIEELAAAKAEHEGFNDDGELRIELNDTNRPDLWSPEGIARQLRCLREDGLRDYPVFAQAKSSTPDRKIVVDAALETVRPFVAAFRAHGVKVTDDSLVAMIQTQEKLAEGYGKKRRNASVGIYNCAKIQWPVHYVGIDRDAEPFVPLGFDEAMTPNQIFEQHPKGRDYAYILEGQAKVPYLRDDAGTVLSMAPIINSRALGEVKPGDDDLMIEVTGADLRGVMLVCNIFAADLTDRGFTCEPIAIDYPYDTELGTNVVCPWDFESTVTLDLAESSKLLGEELQPADVTAQLERYGCRVEAAGAGALQVTIPPWRMDYMHPVDALEDYAMARGYNNFEPVDPPDYTIGALHRTTTYTDRVRDHLIGCGFEETIGNALTDRKIICAAARDFAPDPVALSNPTSETTAVLRNALLPGLLALEAASRRATYPHRIFEVGDVQVRAEGHAHGSHTEIHAAGVVAAPEVAFSEMHALLESLSFHLGWEIALTPEDKPLFIPGRSASIALTAQGPSETEPTVRVEQAGWIGEVHPESLELFGIHTPCVGFEIYLTTLPETGPAPVPSGS
ncbi:MAG: phenylalanine--tRNA ligase subunit beta [Planctomycetota bacterium]